MKESEMERKEEISIFNEERRVRNNPHLDPMYEPFQKGHFEVFVDDDKILRLFTCKCLYEKNRHETETPDGAIKSNLKLKLGIYATPYTLAWFNNLNYDKIYNITYKLYSQDSTDIFEYSNPFILEKAVLESDSVNKSDALMISADFKGISAK